MSVTDDEVAAVKAETAKLLGVSVEELGYIDAELLAMKPRDVSSLDESELGDVIDETPTQAGLAPAPNRRWYANRLHYVASVRRWVFYRDCSTNVADVYGVPVEMWDRSVRDGTCRYGDGHMWRYQVWFYMA